MRFDGRVQFEGVPDELDVSVEVSDTHIRMLSGDEVLGSWCLADVVANRKVANEFEIELPEETVTFRADDQVNFAYGAVQKMAEGWARYHSMNAIRRGRAVANARRHNEPVRLEAVKQALRDASEALTAANATYVRRLEEQAAGVTPPAGGGFWAKVRDATGVSLDPSFEPSDGEGEQVDGDELDRMERMRSSFGRRGLPRLDGFPHPPVRSVSETDSALPTEARPEDAPDGEEEAPAPWIAPPPPPDPVESPPPVSPAAVETAPPATEPAADGSTIAPVRPPVGSRAARRLGAYGDGHHPAETSGIRATMRSMFSRSKAPHEHSFVKTTTAAGITRRLCLECGQVSIGVTDGGD